MLRFLSILPFFIAEAAINGSNNTKWLIFTKSIYYMKLIIVMWASRRIEILVFFLRNKQEIRRIKFHQRMEKRVSERFFRWDAFFRVFFQGFFE